jgi:outer membrane protein assembly factor BamB
VEKPVTEPRRESWQEHVRRKGFRETALTFLRNRIRQEGEKERLDRLIRRLSKYDPHLEIVKHLRQNPIYRNHIEELVSDLPEVSAEPEVHFVFRGGGNVPNTPALGEGRLYLGSGEKFYALDAELGTILWLLRSAGRVWSTACLAEDGLYVSSGGTVFALSLEDGSERWRFEVGKRLGSPFAHQGRVFVGSEQGTLYALDAGSGRRLWTFNVARPIGVAPGVWQDKIFAPARDHALYAVRMDDGECVWRFTTNGTIYGAPHVGEGVVYLTSADHKVYALFAASGQPIWSFATGSEVHTSPFERDGMVYVTSRDRHLYVLNSESGEELWRRKMLGPLSSPTAARGMVYFSAQGRVYGVSIEDHKMRWCFPLGFSVTSTPVVGRRRIYVGTREGTLVCLRLKWELDEQGAAQVLRQFVTPQSEAPSE